MIGIYFSGTGNSKYALELFLDNYNKAARAFPLEDKNIIHYIKENKEIVFSYSVQFSSLPKMLKDFIDHHKHLWRGKIIFVIATMGLFSGDGAGILARRLQKYGAEIIGGLHLKMPDSIADEKALKRPITKNKELVKKAEKKIYSDSKKYKKWQSPTRGTGLFMPYCWIIGPAPVFPKKNQALL